MCGRYTLTATLEDLQLRYEIGESSYEDFTPRYNIAPMQMIPAIIHDGKGNRVGQLRWGLVPSWAADDKIGNKMINARSETVLKKPAFKTLVARKRCIIPSDGFYEWKMENGKKQPIRIVMKDRSIFSMAGLYDTWLSSDGRKISTCTIITTEPNRLMKDIHNRMPAILKKEDEPLWLNRYYHDAQEIMSLLGPFNADMMHAYPVSSVVGNVRNDIPRCIEEISHLG